MGIAYFYSHVLFGICTIIYFSEVEYYIVYILSNTIPMLAYCNNEIIFKILCNQIFAIDFYGSNYQRV